MRWFTDKGRNKQDVIDDITDEYSDEKRPGLIYGQLVDFVRVMPPGDYVVISSEGSNFVTIGTIGDVFTVELQKPQIFEDEIISDANIIFIVVLPGIKKHP